MISASLAIRVHFELRIVILMIAFPLYVMAVTKVAIPTFSFQFTAHLSIMDDCGHPYARVRLNGNLELDSSCAGDPRTISPVARHTEPVESGLRRLSATTPIRSPKSVPDTVFPFRRAECHNTYPVLAYLTDKARVIECRDRMQWILQYRRSVCPNSWRGVSFCRRRE
jgi:hypothetical protein